MYRGTCLFRIYKVNLVYDSAIHSEPWCCKRAVSLTLAETPNTHRTCFLLLYRNARKNVPRGRTPTSGWRKRSRCESKRNMFPWAKLYNVAMGGGNDGWRAFDGQLSSHNLSPQPALLKNNLPVPASPLTHVRHLVFWFVWSPTFPSQQCRCGNELIAANLFVGDEPGVLNSNGGGSVCGVTYTATSNFQPEYEFLCTGESRVLCGTDTHISVYSLDGGTAPPPSPTPPPVTAPTPPPVPSSSICEVC